MNKMIGSNSILCPSMELHIACGNAGNRTLNLKTQHPLSVKYKVRLFHLIGQVEIVRLSFSGQPECYRALSRCPGDSASHFSKACYLIKCIIHYSPSRMI